MKRKAVLIISKNENNQVVTSMYLEIVLSMMKKAGFECLRTNDINSINRKRDFIILDTCKEAFKYWVKGYKNIIIWIQGVVPEERLMMGQPKYKYYAHSLIEKIMLNKAKFLFMVSEAMLHHYEHKYGLTLDGKTYIMPCYNEDHLDDNSFEDDEKYQKNTFLYAGSLQKWQCFEETVNVYKMIEAQLSNTKLIVYTDEKDKALSIVEAKQIKNYLVDYVPASELGDKIKNLKFGFVLRKDDVVNEVATPTKISNYISHGIIPIYSSCLRSFDEYNKRIKLAIPLDLNNINVGIARIIKYANKNIESPKMKQVCENVFKDYYNRNRYINNGSKQLKRFLD